MLLHLTRNERNKESDASDDYFIDYGDDDDDDEDDYYYDDDSDNDDIDRGRVNAHFCVWYA